LGTWQLEVAKVIRELTLVKDQVHSFSMQAKDMGGSFQEKTGNYDIQPLLD
jgi:hypothetical protein